MCRRVKYGILRIGRLDTKFQTVSREKVFNKKGKKPEVKDVWLKTNPVSCKETQNCHPAWRCTN